MEPVSAVGSIVSAGSSITANVQLEQVKKGLNNLTHLVQNLAEGQRRLQTIASIGSMASVLGLGVSMGGFALLYAQVNKLGRKVDDLGELMKNLFEREHRMNAENALDRCRGAFKNPNRVRRREILRDEERVLDKETTYFFRQFFGNSLDRGDQMAEFVRTRYLLSRKLDPRGMLDALSWLLVLSNARLEALMLLGDPSNAHDFATVLQQRLGTLSVQPRELVDARLAGRPVGRETLERVTEQSVQVREFLTAVCDQAIQRPAIYELLKTSGADTEAYVDEVEEYPESEVLVFLPTA